MAQFQRYSIVIVAKMIQPPSAYDGWHLNQRQPQIGDRGTLIDELKAPNGTKKFVVEKTMRDGSTEWLSDFFAEELESA